MRNGKTFERQRDPWIVLIVFVVAMTISLFAAAYEKQRNYETVLARFEQETEVIQGSLDATFDAYAQVLRSGAALFQATENVTREDWRRFVSRLDLDKNYPGIQGLSFNPILHSKAELDAFVTQVQIDDWDTFAVRPNSDGPLFAPILYLEPLAGRNRPALGFDIYSEANRRAAIERSLLIAEPSMTSKITLVQDDESLDDETKAGVLVVLPIFDTKFGEATHSHEKGIGLIVSVFRIRDLMDAILYANFDGEGLYRKNVSLFEVTLEGDLLEMYNSSEEDEHLSLYATETTFSHYGKTWRLATTSTVAFENATRLNSHIIVLITGMSMSMLLTFLVWGQALRSAESHRAADALGKGNAQIALLMKEVNHRSKNLLSLIQAIARQTSAGSSPEDFTRTFSQRLASLSASQDLLVKSNWEEVSLQELMTAQLGHFGDMVGRRILFSGPKILLDAANAQTTSMAIHELATNAVKYGALSNDSGLVKITWTTKGFGSHKRFQLHWVESGGPPVIAPLQKGFGSKVTGAMVKMSLNGEIETKFLSEGFEWHLECHFDVLAKESRTGVS
jgi:two-component sensor histidine kinase